MSITTGRRWLMGCCWFMGRCRRMIILPCRRRFMVIHCRCRRFMIAFSRCCWFVVALSRRCRLSRWMSGRWLLIIFPRPRWFMVRWVRRCGFKIIPTRCRRLRRFCRFFGCRWQRGSYRGRCCLHGWCGRRTHRRCWLRRCCWISCRRCCWVRDSIQRPFYPHNRHRHQRPISMCLSLNFNFIAKR